MKQNKQRKRERERERDTGRGKESIQWINNSLTNYLTINKKKKNSKTIFEEFIRQTLQGKSVFQSIIDQKLLLPKLRNFFDVTFCFGN